MGNLNAGPRRVLARVHGRYESMRIDLGHLVLQPGHILPLGKGEDDFRLVSLVHAFPVDISSPHPHLADNQVVHLLRFPGNDKHGPVGILALLTFKFVSFAITRANTSVPALVLCAWKMQVTPMPRIAPP